ncbi:hypothetical protein TNIN_21221 [Trichonephila inaurata madagascariensis]|uniref:C2H2-type domain-containing protein n=1 Tax=Trichonephila inaurata madagascariensis TaxID=2747483 RepID=A0A8X6Y9S9_9ARAC|nr:hypothetical protein TNIN_21221 [Trichonephila inaurata madagascariensis]
MSKEPDKTEDSDKIRQLAHGDGKISETLSLDTEEVGIPDSTSKPKLSQENYPQKVDTSELKLEKNKTSVDETEKSKNEFDCKKCREGLKDFEGMTAHDSFHIENKKSSLHISKVFDHLQKKENSKLITQTSDNENISVSSTSKISSPSCKISEHDSLQLLPLAKSKQIYTPSINTLGGYSSRSPTSSVESQKLQSRRSFPLTKTMRSEVKKPKRVSNKNLMYVKPPRLIMPKPSKELKDDSDPDDSASRDLSESYRTSCIANTNRPPDIEVPNRVFSNYPVDVTPPRRVINHMPVNLFQSPQMYNTQTISAFAGNIVIPAPLNLDQSPRIYNTETLTSSGTVIIPAPVNILQSRAIYITHVPSDSSGGVMSPNSVICQPSPIYSTEIISDSSGSVGNPSVVNLVQSPQLYNIQTFTDSSGSVMNPTPVNLQSPRIYDTETCNDFSGNIVIPGSISFDQSPRLYNTETLTDTSESTKNPTPVNLFQTPEIKEPTTRTISTQTESEKCDSPKSLTIASPKPVSSPLKKEQE